MGGPQIGMGGFMGFGMFGTIFSILFVLIAGVILFTIVKGVAQWQRNNEQPELAVEARLVSKRTNVSHSTNASDNMSHSSSTAYFATFEVESGDRMEFRVSGSEFGMLAEGDVGRLSFQGTRYKGFIRNRSMSSY
jgi:hypothetical protein